MTEHGRWHAESASELGDAPLLRGLLLVLVILGATGLVLELLLLEHTESVWQWVPIVLLAMVLATSAGVAKRPGRTSFRAFRAVMILCVAVGLLGLYLHYVGNVEWELESNPSVRGLDLAWRALTGATPALAPAALAQLGVLGLLYTFRHPTSRGANRPTSERHRET